MPTNLYPHLTSPIQLGNVTFRHRMFSAPMGATDITADCSPGPRTQGFYELRARGGAAAVTVSELVVHPETDGSHMLHLNLTTPGNLAAHTFMADAIRRHGAVPSIEFSHSGQYAGTYLTDRGKQKGICQWGPSDNVRPDGTPVKGLSKEQIADIVKTYGETAALAKRAGYEMIMVHAGHGWLINQFLSPWFNKREDEYGGSLENRVRFAREILTAIRESVGPAFPIELRMSGSELFEGGYDLEEGCRIAHALEDYVDLIHVSAGSYQFGFFSTHLPMFAPHGGNVYLAAEIKKHVSKPVATIGAINDPAMMEEIIASGKADVIYMARELLADPFLPSKVMVSGGGVAGLKAAITAAQRGHQVVLCEKSDQVGGILKAEQAIDFKHEMYELGLTLERQALAEGVEIRVNTTVTPEYVEAEKPDALILAVGSTPIVPPLPGIKGDNVVVVNNYYLESHKVGDSVVVLGGGLAGCECAVHLQQAGKTVHLVEMRNTLAPDCNIRHRPILMQKIDEGVKVHLGTAGQSVTAEGLVVKNEDGTVETIPCDTVICAVGQRANRADVDALRLSAPFVREVGDCIRPANITKAMYEGYHAALDI